jgi:hypothetical protein
MSAIAASLWALVKLSDRLPTLWRDNEKPLSTSSLLNVHAI